LQRRNTSPRQARSTRGPQVFIRVDGAYDSVHAIADNADRRGGADTEASDIANVSRGYEDPPTYLIRTSEPTIMLAVVMQEAEWSRARRSPEKTGGGHRTGAAARHDA